MALLSVRPRDEGQTLLRDILAKSVGDAEAPGLDPFAWTGWSVFRNSIPEVWLDKILTCSRATAISIGFLFLQPRRRFVSVTSYGEINSREWNLKLVFGGVLHF